MKIFGNLTELLSLVFRKNGNTVTIQPPSSPSGNETINLPDIASSSLGSLTADTLVGVDSTQTLTNKTLTSPAINGGVLDNASTLGGVSGSQLSSDHSTVTAATNLNTAGTLVKRDGSGNFSAGTITANLSGNATTATTASSSGTFTGSFSGDVTGGQSSTVVASVGGSSAANVHSAELAANAATNLNTASTIVKRDSSGNFSAGTITANLTGTATGLSGTNLTGDVSNSGNSVTVNQVGTSSAANIHSAELAANAAVSTNTASTIVKRDASGNFAAGTITANLTGTASQATTSVSFSGSLGGDVTGTQAATVVGSVGGSSAANVHAAELAANAATSSNTVSTIVKRDGSGNFSAGTITASLSGNATTATSAGTAGSATNFTGSLAGDVTGTQSATSVNKVNGGTVPVSKTIVGTNASGQLIDASSATLSNNTSGTAGGLTGTALTGDVSNSGNSVTVNQVKGGVIPVSKTIVGTNSSGQIVDATGATLTNNTSGTAANVTATSNSTLATLSALSLPGGQVSGNISGNAANVTGTVAVGNGGTGSTTASGARTNLGAAASGANTDITSLAASGNVAGATLGVSGSAGSGYLNLQEQSATPSNPAASNLRVYAKSDDKLYTLNSAGVETAVGSGSGNSIVVASSSFSGFTPAAADVGTPVYLNSSGLYLKAIATASSTAEVAGVISGVSGSNVTVSLGGDISSVGTNAAPSGLVAGTVYFLSATTAGQLTATEPTTVGYVSKPVGVARTTSTLEFFNMRGQVVGGANARTQISLPNNATQTVQNVSSYTAGELAGYVTLTNTTAANSLIFYVKAPFAQLGAGGNWNISPSYVGDTPPSGFSMTITSAGLIQVTLPNWTGYASAAINFALNVPAVGTNFPLSVSASSVLGNAGVTPASNQLGYLVQKTQPSVTAITSASNSIQNAVFSDSTTSISLTPGIWLLTAQVYYSGGTGLITCSIGISTDSNSSTFSDASYATNRADITQPSGAGDTTVVISNYYQSVTTTTSYYLKLQPVYSTAPSYRGRLTAVLIA